MDIELSPGTYVVAVSGGVDSMALLDWLNENNEGQWKLVVAHLDHGIREDSHEDRRLVAGEAKRLGLPFVYHEIKLGPGASEAEARTARYDFLRQVQRASNARAIITAHHQDDLLETAILNILRGSGRKGLTALGSRHDLERPLLVIPKQDIIKRAQQRSVRWREDSTNQDLRLNRNYVRHKLLSRFNEADRDQLLQHIEKLRAINHELDTALATALHIQSKAGTLDRDWFGHLPHSVAREVMAAWLRAHGVRDFDKRLLERVVVAAKTGKVGSHYDVLGGQRMRINRSNLALVRSER
jgi:tRNA(Ile)-lysidine synthetase-like protein